MASDSKTGKRILLGVVVAILGGGMLALSNSPRARHGGDTSASDTVASVGDQNVTMAEVAPAASTNRTAQFRAAFFRRAVRTADPQAIMFQKELEYEGHRLGITVSDQERADRIKQFLPTAFNGDSFVGMDRYTQGGFQLFNLTVPVFEEYIRKACSKRNSETGYRRHQRQSCRVAARVPRPQREDKLDYVLIRPERLETKIVPTDAEIKAQYEKNRAVYQLPDAV